MKTIIEMAREAGWKDLRDYDSEMHDDFFMGNIDSLKDLVEIVRADEREACAKVCEDMRVGGAEYEQRCENAIRARGNT
jgi:hypothetical protein